MGGKWQFQDGRATDTRVFPVYWNYHELMNYSSLVAETEPEEFTRMTAVFKLDTPKLEYSEALMVFAMNSPYMHYYYSFFAVKLSGDKEKIRKAELIMSSRTDDSLPYTAKNNYKIETLASVPWEMEYGRDCTFRIDRSKTTVTFYADSRKILTQKLPVKIQQELKGKFALGARGAAISIDSCKIINGKKTVFEDSFESDSVFVPTVKAVQVKK